ncbi:MAG: hypothetical protein WCJ39_03420 [bacterium]
MPSLSSMQMQVKQSMQNNAEKPILTSEISAELMRIRAELFPMIKRLNDCKREFSCTEGTYKIGMAHLEKAELLGDSPCAVYDEYLQIESKAWHFDLATLLLERLENYPTQPLTKGSVENSRKEKSVEMRKEVEAVKSDVQRELGDLLITLCCLGNQEGFNFPLESSYAAYLKHVIEKEREPRERFVSLFAKEKPFLLPDT